MLSGWRRASLFVSHFGSFFTARLLSVRMPPSMMDCVDHEARFGTCTTDQGALTCATWMFSGPNSLFRLWLKLRTANFVTENMLVIVLPLRVAVAPVKISVPLLRAFIRVIDRIGQFVAFESRHDGSRERKGPDYPGGGRAFDVIVRHLKELLESSFPSVIDGDANLR